MTQQNDSAPEWVKEEMYFGNAAYPSWTVYRRSGERVQIQAEWEMRVEPHEESHFGFAIEEPIREFLAKYQDCFLSFTKGYTASDGRDEKPRAWLTGWADVTTPEQWERYRQDKSIAMRGPNDTF